MYLKFGKKIDVPDRLHTTIFDMNGAGGRVLHPELQSVKPTPADRERVINYDMKDGDFVGELETPLVNDARRDAAEAEAAADADGGEGGEKKEDTVPAWARMLNKANSTSEGMALLAEKAPHVYYMNVARIKPMLAAKVGTPAPKLFTLDDFNAPALELDGPVVLHGPSEFWKTAYAKAHFERPLMVRRPDDLKRLSEANDGIIFDDCNFRKWEPEDAIALLDFDEERSLPARYSDAFIAAEMPMIFTTNRKPAKIFPRSSIKKQRKAIARRYKAVEVTTCLMKLGRPMTPAEKRARREAGRDGPRGPGV